MSTHVREADIRARRNKQAILQFLTRIAEFNQALPNPPDEGSEPERPLRYVLEECRRLARPGTALFILSDFHDFDDEAAKVLTGLGRHTEMTLCWITDPLESSLELSGRFGMSDGRASRSIDVSGELRDRYRARRRDQQDRLEEAARRSRARLVPVSTAQDPILFLRQLYRG